MLIESFCIRDSVATLDGRARDHPNAAEKRRTSDERGQEPPMRMADSG